ncbi:hypothetical protein C6Y56_06950 [Pseudomonas fluorescens]|uniref:Uncharacterized protein n=2 Tax=Pseudomonas TaxID=286 RepID=A0A7Z3C2I7_PSEFL|nr:hypothetical protein C6Y56_06950 [Pseudomonas fluorescens]
MEREIVMNDLNIDDVKSFPKALGSLFARTTRFDPTDPLSVIDTKDVFLRNDGVYYTAGGRVATSVFFTSIIFELPPGLAIGKHALGPGGIGVRYFVDDGGGEEYFRAFVGEITFTGVAEGRRYQASDFQFKARIGSAGKTVEVMMGKLDIS